jgi:nucleosome binding factor SPN SPT16 subunit
MTSYQKLKEENKKLKQDIYNLIRHENDMVGMVTKMNYNLQFELNDFVWQGSTDDVMKVKSKVIQ